MAEETRLLATGPADGAGATPDTDAGGQRPNIQIADGSLWVDGTRRLIVGGEVHNSGTSSVSEIHRTLDAAVDLGIEVVLAPIAWGLIEPTEGAFDLFLVDALIDAARTRELLLIPLWFGSWKNGMSTYTPTWVKTDPTRFPRIQLANGDRTEAVSPFGQACRDADTRAFATLMQHLADNGADVVLMVQVENEVGTLGAPRDFSPLAESAWTSAVPDKVIDAVAITGSGRLHEAWAAAGSLRAAAWAEAFGEEAAEAFMAWAYASYVEQVAAAGRAHLDVPLFVNAWLDVVPEGQQERPALTGGVQAGDYPSGGPLRHTACIWRATAPTIDLLAPDIYAGPFDALCAEYFAASGGLFIPEMRCDRVGVAQMFRAVGEFGAIGVSPFAFDAVPYDDPDRARLTDAYSLLSAVGRLLADYPEAELRGFVLDESNPCASVDLLDSTVEIIGDHHFEIFPPEFPGYGMLLAAGEQCFVIGRGFSARWLDPAGRRKGFLRLDELELTGDGFRVVRRLNGDEGGEWLRMPAVQQLQTDTLPIRQNLRLTGIVAVETYDL